MIASGVFSSWAADAKASRQQLQCSSVIGSSFCLTGDTCAGCMGAVPFPFLIRRNSDLFAGSGKIPDFRFTGILSTKIGRRFSQSAILGRIERKHSTGGELILP